MKHFCLLIAYLVMPLLAGAAETPRDAQGVPQTDVHGRRPEEEIHLAQKVVIRTAAEHCRSQWLGNRVVRQVADSVFSR